MTSLSNSLHNNRDRCGIDDYMDKNMTILISVYNHFALYAHLINELYIVSQKSEGNFLLTILFCFPRHITHKVNFEKQLIFS